MRALQAKEVVIAALFVIIALIMVSKEGTLALAMNSNQLLLKFSQGINWNAFFYVFYKASYTLLSFLLFRCLTTNDFSTWANINSIIFLLLLWIDFGFRKSVPRFCPEYSRSKDQHRQFIRRIIFFQTIILIASLPLFFMLTRSMSTLLHLNSQRQFLYIAGFIFFTEGIVAVLRLIYHSHFWHKQFNTLNSAVLTLEMCSNLFLIITITSSPSLLTYIFLTKLSGSMLLIILGIGMFRTLYNATHYDTTTNDPMPAPHQAFIKHSAIMWFNTSIKSLTERNFMVPLLTYSLGAAQANLFKVAHDASLLLYRSVVKTIGTTDTSLLAHAQTSTETSLLNVAFNKLTHKITLLCLPLFGILALCAATSSTHSLNTFMLQAFLVITVSYLLEALLSPYERILEVKGHYKTLFVAYIPYLIGLVVLMSYNLVPTLGLIGFIIFIHIARLTGSVLMTYFAYKKYKLELPLKNMSWLVLIQLPIIITAYAFVSFTQTGNYVSTLFSSIIISK